MNGNSRQKTKSQSRLKSRGGFTLMEVMISVVIIGVIASLAGPRLSKEITKIQFRGSARDLVSTLREARSRAITEKQEYAVAFDSNTGTYTLFQEGGTADVFVRSDTVSGAYPTISQTFTGPLVFSPDGSASSSGQIFTFAYDNDGGFSTTSYATIDILASTGRIKLSEIHTY